MTPHSRNTVPRSYGFEKSIASQDWKLSPRKMCSDHTSLPALRSFMATIFPTLRWLAEYDWGCSVNRLHSRLRKDPHKDKRMPLLYKTVHTYKLPVFLLTLASSAFVAHAA